MLHALSELLGVGYQTMPSNTRNSLPLILQDFISVDPLPFSHVILSLDKTQPFNRFTLTFPSKQILCSINIVARGMPVYQLSINNLCQLFRGIHDNKCITMLPDACKSGCPEHFSIAPVCTSKLYI